MGYVVLLGSDKFIGTSGIISVEKNGKLTEFIRVREIFRVRSEGSYLAVDVDIKDKDGQREIKLFKNNPVAGGEGLDVEVDKKHTLVTREDGSTVIKIEQLEVASVIPSTSPSFLLEAMKEFEVEAAIRITGEFYAGPYLLQVDERQVKIGNITLMGNTKIGSRGILLTEMGFAM